MTQFLTYINLASIMRKAFILLFLFLSSTSFGHLGPSPEYLCSVTQMNANGEFKEVVNVVFLPEWQKRSHLYHTDQIDIFFEMSPIKDFKGDEVDQEMKLTFIKVGEKTPLRVTTAPKFSEISTNDYENNLGSRCFHRSMRGKIKLLFWPE